MSAVEQAREGLRAAYHAWWSDQTPISVVMAAEEKLIAAVRAEEGKRWREGMEAVKLVDIGDDASFYHNAALAALAARMEAK